VDGEGLDAPQDSKTSGEMDVGVNGVSIQRIHRNRGKLGVTGDTLNSAVFSTDWASRRANEGCAAPTC